MSDWEEDVWEDGEAWGSEDEAAATPNAWSPRGLGGLEYEVLAPEDVMARQEDIMHKVQEQLYTTRDDAAALLRYYQYDTAKMMDAWLASPDAVREAVGIAEPVAPPHMDECPLCFEPLFSDTSLALPCGHLFCTDCWANWANAETDKGPAALSTQCIAYKCRQLIPESILYSLLNTKKKAKLRAWALDAFIQGSRSCKWCPGPGCDRAVDYRPGGTKDVVCACGHIFCFRCGMEGHRPASCDEVDQWTRKNSTDSENVNWILANTKRCPKCDVNIEKNHGCNHMSCRNCRYEFCWLCKGEWSTHGSATGGYYQCNKYEKEKQAVEKSVIDEEKQADEARTALQKYMFYFSRFDNHDKSITFAEETRRKAEDVMAELQDKLGTNYQDVQFVLHAVNAVIECRRVLKWSYCFGYYLEDPTAKTIFENHQERLEKFTEELHEQSEKPIEDLLESSVRTQIVNYTRVVEKYRCNVIDAIESGLVTEAV